MADDGDQDLLAFIGEDNLVGALEAYAEANGNELLTFISNQFDVGGQQHATRAEPIAVRKVMLSKDGFLIARVDFSITYKNPVDEEDRDLSAENVTEDTFDVRLTGMDVTLDVGGVEPVPQYEGFPT